MSLRALDQKFRTLIARCDDQVNLDADEPDVLSWRAGELRSLINTTPPSSVADCVTKLRLLTHPDLGIGAGDRLDDIISICQVIAFLEALAAEDVV